MATFDAIIDKDYSPQADGSRTASITVRVISTVFAESEANILTAAGISIGSQHPNDAGCWCTGLRCKIEPSKQFLDGVSFWYWTVRADYSSRGRRNCNDFSITDPLEMRPIIEWVFEDREEPVNKGKLLIANEPSEKLFPIANSAGQPFLDPVMKDATRMRVRITRNEATMDPTLMRQYNDALNSDEFLLLGYYFQRGMCKLKWKATPRYVGNCGLYFEHTYEIELLPLVEGINDANTCTEYSGFDKALIDQGTSELIGDGGSPEVFTLRAILDESGVPVSQEVPLNGGGEALTLPIDESDPGSTPVTIGYRVYDEMPFAALSLPEDAL